uniref:Uncharacterized protein n=1 Tax=Panagrolaimus sp. JU765 TaxID=591449 RepID=A0AC34QLB2_9BILA
MWRELFFVACLVPAIIMEIGLHISECYHEENGIISSKLYDHLGYGKKITMCIFEYDEQLSKHVRRTAPGRNEEIRLRPEPYPDRPGYNITRECGPWTKIRLESEPHDDECTRFPNGSATCICDREQCNNQTFTQCYGYSNETTAALLETCPLKTTGCFVARDPKTQKLIEAGCDVSDHGSQLVEKCSSDGCNYPMYCYDSSKEAVVQCKIGDVGCYVEFEQQGPHEAKQVSGCSPNINSNVSNPSGAVCSLNGGKKQCICSGDMCNHETHFESITCQVSNGSGSMESIKCPLGTTECYIVDEKDGKNNMGCSIFNGNEGCSMENGVKTCFCHDDLCNQNVSQIHCYIADQNTPAVLKTCPFEAIGCYVARDEQTWKLIEAGCDVGAEGGHHMEKCFGDGCNHPFHCYDVGRNKMQQCDHHVTTCFTTFEKTNGVLKTSSGCDFGKFGFSLPSNGSTCLVKDGQKYCGCVGEMCNYDKTVQKISCLTSNSTSAAVMKECPIYTTHCFVKMDAKYGKLIQQGCSVFEVGDSCLVEDGVETCQCVGDKCNHLSPPDASLPFAKLYRYVVYSQFK